MPSQLLENTRSLNRILQNAGPDGVLFTDLAKVLGDIIKCNIFVISRKGKVLGHSISKSFSTIPYDIVNGEDVYLTDEFNNRLLLINETVTNIISTDLPSKEYDNENVYYNIAPINCGGDRLGTLLIETTNGEFSHSEIILAEYSATAVGMEIMRAKAMEIEDETRKQAVVQMAIGTLSYSELEAVEHVFAELSGKDEGLLVASKIADRVGITRSVIVNALRKFESAGVIESRSLGMKGTHIRILNDKLLPELDKLK